eukprot:5410984-Alexandrium_andersonii.AAC.2
MILRLDRSAAGRPMQLLERRSKLELRGPRKRPQNPLPRLPRGGLRTFGGPSVGPLVGPCSCQMRCSQVRCDWCGGCTCRPILRATLRT